VPAPKGNANAKRHGHTSPRRSLTYNSWRCMKERCHNPKHKWWDLYGGRGITICDRWLERKTGFANFLADMGERPSKGHTLHRVDNDSPYCPDNCTWATKYDQNAPLPRDERGRYGASTPSPEPAPPPY
jgi:hypothetical protein